MTESQLQAMSRTGETGEIILRSAAGGSSGGGSAAAIRSAEIAHSGMTYGDEKNGAISEYARGWGDCLKAIKSAATPSDECSHGVKFYYECGDCRARAKADTAEMLAKATGSAS